MRELIGIAGAAGIACGLAMFSVPAAVMLAGALLLAGAIFYPTKSGGGR